MQIISKYKKWVILSLPDSEYLDDEGYSQPQLKDAKYYNTEEEAIKVAKQITDGELKVIPAYISYEVQLPIRRNTDES